LIEVRPIVQAEADRFLVLLCDVFGLDYGRAHSVFFTEPMYELNRKWALFENGEMLSILTTTPLIFGWGRAFGIAGVATRPDRQHQGLAGRLLEAVMEHGKRNGEGAALLFAKSKSLYERMGFVELDRVIRAALVTVPPEPDQTYEPNEIKDCYAAWACQDPNRLRRDDQRWRYWNWHFRICSPFQDGYICFEPGLLREAIFSQPVQAMPIPHDAEWLGLTNMADALRIPIRDPRPELFLMGRNFSSPPQMFMTDQF
jgi:GNAT superfamily N-acetyltransferase